MYVPFFQPQFDLRNGEMVGAEALAGGMDGTGRMILPERIHCQSMQAGAAWNLDFRIFEQILKVLGDWKRKCLISRIQTVSVSFSIGNLTSVDTVAAISSILKLSDIPSEMIGVKVKMTGGRPYFQQDVCRNVQILYWSGLRMVSHYCGEDEPDINCFDVPIHAVTLDESLVDKVEDGGDGKAAIEKICGYYREHTIPCIAEGVERKEQVEALLQAGCNYGQGSYYSNPLPAQEFEYQYLKRGGWNGR